MTVIIMVFVVMAVMLVFGLVSLGTGRGVALAINALLGNQDTKGNHDQVCRGADGRGGGDVVMSVVVVAVLMVAVAVLVVVAIEVVVAAVVIAFLLLLGVGGVVGGGVGGTGVCYGGGCCCGCIVYVLRMSLLVIGDGASGDGGGGSSVDGGFVDCACGCVVGILRHGSDGGDVISLVFMFVVVEAMFLVAFFSVGAGIGVGVGVTGGVCVAAMVLVGFASHSFHFTRCTGFFGRNLHPFLTQQRRLCLMKCGLHFRRTALPL